MDGSGRSGWRWAGVALLVAVMAGFGCEGAGGVSSTDTPPPPTAATAAAMPPIASGSQTASAAQLADAGASTAQLPDAEASAQAEVADEGSLVIEGILVDAPTMGRPGPGVLIVANDPRYRLPVRVLRVSPADAEGFAVGEQVVLGIHSPSRTFPGGAAKGKRVRLRIHWRQGDGGPRRYYHVRRDRGALDDR